MLDLDKMDIDDLVILDIDILSDKEIMEIYFKVNTKVSKYSSHLIRLLLECLQILTEKTLTFPLPQHNLVRDVKLGKYDLTWVLNKAEEIEKLVDLAYVQSDLQYGADQEAINKLQIELLEDFWQERRS